MKKRTKRAETIDAVARRGNLNLPAAKLPSMKPERDFRRSIHWRIFRIIAEFVDGFQYIADLKRCVTVFGSTRVGAQDPWYREARRLGHLLARQGYSVVTGGGPGIMEAANRGAAEAGRDSIGINIQLPREQRANPYVTKSIGFHYFFTRKLMLTYAAEAYVYFPGGFGTLDEFFEIITLIQTKKISRNIPVILVGRDYWRPLTDWITRELYARRRAIDKADTNIFVTVNTAAEAMRIIRKRAKRRVEF